MFKEQLKKLRIDKGYTLRGFAKELCIAPSYLSDLEHGYRVMPFDLLERIHALVDIPNYEQMEYLLAMTRSELPRATVNQVLTSFEEYKKFKRYTMNKIIAVDFDGTLCENKFPKIGKPNENIIDYVKHLKTNNTLILWTCRRGKKLTEAVRWCKEHGIEFDYINENVPTLIEQYGGDCRKIFADIYVDDKAVNVKEIL